MICPYCKCSCHHDTGCPTQEYYIEPGQETKARDKTHAVRVKPHWTFQEIRQMLCELSLQLTVAKLNGKETWVAYEFDNGERFGPDNHYGDTIEQAIKAYLKNNPDKDTRIKP